MLLEKTRALIQQSGATAANHPFFRRFGEEKSLEQIKSFAVQWYFAARGHKEAFPYLVATTKNDETRQELTKVLYDEFGNGDPEKIHSRLLGRFLTQGLFLEQADVEQVPILPEIADFGETTLALWSTGDFVEAFGHHYALEEIAKDIHPVFAAGLTSYGFPPDVLEYFTYHALAEEEHTRIAETGFRRYASATENH